MAVRLISEKLANLLPPVPALVDYAKPLPVEDDDDDRGAEDLGYAEGQSFMIEYVDSKGNSSTRRITVFQIVKGINGVPSLMARCHERQAMRQFRVDRIKACIDYDGEIFDNVPTFLVETFGISIQHATAKPDSAAADVWQSIVAKIRPRAALLAAVSRSDGIVRSVETEVAAAYLVRHVERDGEQMVSPDDFKRINTYLRRLRPTEEAIDRAIEYLRGCDEADIVNLFRACVDVMRADGREHPLEINLINEMAYDIFGVEIL